MAGISVVISYYKSPDNLRLILDALGGQSTMDFEVIVSEDDNNPETLQLLDELRKTYPFEILHLHQDKDEGFRKNSMLNRVIRESRTSLLAFIDGDCIPHRHFVKEYLRNLKGRIFLAGRSVMLGRKISADLLRKGSARQVTFLQLLFSDSTHVKEGFYFPFFPLAVKMRGLVGRNWGIDKKYLEEVNGFDEDYQAAGVGEDVDIEWRLLANGVERKSVKNRAIVYHMYHARGYSEDGVQHNYRLMAEKQQRQEVRCLNGLKKLGPQSSG